MPTITQKRRRIQRAMPTLEDLFEDLESASGEEREEMLFEQASQELETGRRRRGIYAMALTRTDGDRERAGARYMQHRVNQLQTEFEAWNMERNEQMSEEQRRAEASADFVKTLLVVALLILAITAIVSWS